jgi:hypothetical protein
MLHKINIFNFHVIRNNSRPPSITILINSNENFAILKSIIDTAIKNNQNVVGALSVIAVYKRN